MNKSLLHACQRTPPSVEYTGRVDYRSGRMGCFARKAMTCITIGTLLFCPYSCLGKAAVAVETTSPYRDCRGGDCCCPSPMSDLGKERPSDSDSGRPYGACLCHGAVLQAPTIVPDFDAGHVTFVAVDNLLPATQSSFWADGLLAVERTACHFPAADSGREVRALIESLLL